MMKLHPVRIARTTRITGKTHMIRSRISYFMVGLPWPSDLLLLKYSSNNERSKKELILGCYLADHIGIIDRDKHSAMAVPAARTIYRDLKSVFSCPPLRHGRIFQVVRLGHEHRALPITPPARRMIFPVLKRGVSMMEIAFTIQ